MFVVEPKLFSTNTIVSLKKSIALSTNRYYNKFGKVTSDGSMYKSLLNVKNQHGEKHSEVYTKISVNNKILGSLKKRTNK